MDMESYLIGNENKIHSMLHSMLLVLNVTILTVGYEKVGVLPLDIIENV